MVRRALSTYVLGLSALYHDSAACLLRDGEICAAAQEERFTRVRHDAALPLSAVRYCLAEAGIGMSDVDHVVFYDKPFVKFERLVDTMLWTAPRSFPSFLRAMPPWLKHKLWTGDLLKENLGWGGKVLFSEHHESHAASAFFPSPFDEAAVLTVDGVGEWATTTLGRGSGKSLELSDEIRFPHSLGLLYSAFTQFCGFKVNSGEYKLMGLAPYGEPRYADLIRRELIDLKDDGSFQLDVDRFEFLAGSRMVGRAFEELFGGRARAPESPLGPRELDLAASIQVVTEEVLLRLARTLHRKTGSKHLCLAGGVALNCVANGRLLREGPFERIWIQPAAGDAGGAVGAALSVWHGYLGNERAPRAGKDSMHGAFLGPSFDGDAVEASLAPFGAVSERIPESELPGVVAGLLAEEKVVGWFQGRMEFGPRALGARSILGDPRSPSMQSVMNLKIKFRESFRPFAPAVLRSEVGDWFELNQDSPYMLLVANVAEKHRIAPREARTGLDRQREPRSTIPAVTHVDGSARIQTVSEAENPAFHALLSAFRDRTGCPVLVNTSFNVRGEPIVCTPADGYRCFMRTEIDALVVGDRLFHRAAQPSFRETEDWRRRHELD
ncbi:MAG TPA: carbamoyltransferase [Polyangiaceae bacterium]|nr:carbamoyltransferase [Polyangiaceae bacterium]